MAKTFSDVLRQALGARIENAAGGFIGMLAESAVMEFPFSPPNMPARLDGRDAIARHLSLLGGLIEFDGFDDVRVHESIDPAVVIVEFSGVGRGVGSGAPYRQRYVSIIRTEAGRIVHYSDYWNPSAVLAALGGQGAYEGAVRAAGIADAGEAAAD